MVVDGLPLFGRVQPAINTTLVSAFKGDGEQRRGAADHDEVALTEARRNKERTYPELVGPGSRARLVVLALEVGDNLVRRSKIICCIPVVVAGWAWVRRASASVA